MKRFSLFTLGVFLAALIIAVSAVPAQKNGKEIVRPASYSPLSLTESADLQSALSQSVSEVLSSGNFKPEELAATLIDLRDPANLKWANINGDRKIYPASVVKMFYMAALERQLEDKKVTLT